MEVEGYWMTRLASVPSTGGLGARMAGESVSQSRNVTHHICFVILFNTRNVRGWRGMVANGRFTLEVMQNWANCRSLRSWEANSGARNDPYR